MKTIEGRQNNAAFISTEFTVNGISMDLRKRVEQLHTQGGLPPPPVNHLDKEAWAAWIERMHPTIEAQAQRLQRLETDRETICQEELELATQARTAALAHFYEVEKLVMEWLRQESAEPLHPYVPLMHHTDTQHWSVPPIRLHRPVLLVRYAGRAGVLASAGVPP